MQQGTRCKWMWNQGLFQFYGVRKAHSLDIWSYLISMINNKKRCSRLSPHPPGINKYIKKEEWYVEIEEDLQMSSIKVNKHRVICKWDLTHWQGRNIRVAAWSSAAWGSHSCLHELGFALGLWEILKLISLEKRHTREVWEDKCY